jgi:hypothetical protein
MKEHEPVHYVGGTDCMDRPESYWRQFRLCSDGTCVIGVGGTPEVAVAEAEKREREHEAFLLKPDLERLAILLQEKYLHQTNMNTTVHLIGKLLLKALTPL